MRDHDIQLVALGIAAGMDLMLLVQMVFAILDNRRDRKARRADQANLQAARRRMDGPDVVDTYTDPALIGEAGRP